MRKLFMVSLFLLFVAPVLSLAANQNNQKSADDFIVTTTFERIP